MKVLFLISALTCTLTVFASTQYTCQATHKHSESGFFLDVGETKEVDLGGWTIYASIKKKKNAMEVSLSRIVNVLDATYKKQAKRAYSKNERKLSVDLEHGFGGRVDKFLMDCYPRD